MADGETASFRTRRFVAAEIDIDLDLSGSDIVRSKNLTYENKSLLPSPPEPPQGGLARWEFNQDTTDSWNGFDGVDKTDSGYTTNSPVGSYAKSFNGIGDQIVFGDALSISSDTTISIWLNSNSFSSLSPMIHKDQSYQFHVNGNGEFWFGTFGYGNKSKALNWTPGDWYHCVIVWDHSTQTASFYRDGISVGSDSGNDNPSGNGTLRLGHKKDGGDWLDGYLADGRFYDFALSETQVSNLYLTGSITK